MAVSQIKCMTYCVPYLRVSISTAEISMLGRSLNQQQSCCQNKCGSISILGKLGIKPPLVLLPGEATGHMLTSARVAFFSVAGRDFELCLHLSDRSEQRRVCVCVWALLVVGD